MKFKIHNLNWEITQMPEKAMLMLLNDDQVQHICGFVDKITLKIFINDNLKDDILKRTIIHEITHAFFWTYGLENFERLEQEDFCNFMETYGITIIELASKVFNNFKKNSK